jgi:hypothetical protein
LQDEKKTEDEGKKKEFENSLLHTFELICAGLQYPTKANRLAA